MHYRVSVAYGVLIFTMFRVLLKFKIPVYNLFIRWYFTKLFYISYTIVNILHTIHGKYLYHKI